MRFTNTEILDKYAQNNFVVEHTITERGLLSLREHEINYEQIIKQNLAKSVAETLTTKMAFTKTTDINTETYIFRGRVWVFTKEELLTLIEEIKNGI